MGKGWAQRAKRRSVGSAATATSTGQAAQGLGAAGASLYDCDETAQEQPVAGVGRGVLATIARALWEPCYTKVFAREIILNEAACGDSVTTLPPNGYRARLKGAQAELYDARTSRLSRDQMAIKLHGNNQQYWSPSLLARSVSYFNLTTHFLHSTETQQRRIASRRAPCTHPPTHHPSPCVHHYLQFNGVVAAKKLPSRRPRRPRCRLRPRCPPFLTFLAGRLLSALCV